MISNLVYDILLGISVNNFNKLALTKLFPERESLEMPCAQLGNHFIFLCQYIQNLIYQMKES